MKTTINKIIKLKPCSTGLDRLLEQLGDFDKDEYFEISSLVGSKILTSDITWLMGEHGCKKQLVEFTVYCAELVLPIYEKDNTSSAPRDAIKLTKKWLNDDSSVTRDELRAAADAADAANAADAAAYTANAAARAAAYTANAAAYTAYTANAAARAAANAAAAARAAARAAANAADADINAEINKKLIEILDSIED